MLIFETLFQNKCKTKQKKKVQLQSTPGICYSSMSLTRNYCIIFSIQIVSSIHTFILNIQQILVSREPVPYTDAFWTYLFLEVKDWIVYWYQKNPNDCPKIFDVQCIWGRIFVSLENIFVFKYSQTIFNLVFRWNIYGKCVTRKILGALFWAPIPFRRYQNTSGCGSVN